MAVTGSRLNRRCLGALATLVAAVAVAVPARAQSLEEALSITYSTSPTLQAQRALLRETNEQVPQALAGSRPFVQGTGSVGAQYLDTDPGGSDTINPASLGISINQPIYRGGRTESELERAEFNIQAQRANLVTTEQQVLLDAVAAYLNVVREQAVLELQINNEEVLERQLQASRDRFAVGEITRTDVSQAESRLAGAVSDRIQAAGDLNTARAEFERVVGQAPTLLTAPGLPAGLPLSLEDSVNEAGRNSPGVISPLFTERAAVANVELIRGELLPELSVTGEVSTNYEPSVNVDDSNSASITAQLTVPLYQAGAVSSRVRAAQHAVAQARADVDDARRVAVDNAISAWENLTTSRASIEAVLAQVSASEIALEGVTQEAQVGSRTVLDVLDAEQELLDARVSLVRASRDEIVAAYELLSAVGRLTARDLNLPVEYYDIDLDYDRTRDLWYGTSIEVQ